MSALVVYDSWYGNTRAIAKAIAEGLGNDVQVINVVDTDPYNFLAGQAVIIVGSPTHGGVPTPAMQDFLNDLPANELEGVAVAAFDTRADARWVKLFGFAGKHIAKQLQAAGGRLVCEPEGFRVYTKKGPLVGGELARARDWAAMIAKREQLGLLA